MAEDAPPVLEPKPADKVVDRDVVAGALVFLAAVAGIWLLAFRGGSGLDAPSPEDGRIVNIERAGPDTAEAPAPGPGAGGGIGGPEAFDLRPSGSGGPLQTPEMPVDDLPPASEPAAPPDAPAARPPARPGGGPGSTTGSATGEPCPEDEVVRAYYCTAKAELSPAARDAFLDILARRNACLFAAPLEVLGYADTRGTRAFNSALAENRAERMAELLREKGLTVGSVKGVGEAPGLPDNRNCPAQRRVDLRRMTEGGPDPFLDCALPEGMAAFDCP